MKHTPQEREILDRTKGVDSVEDGRQSTGNKREADRKALQERCKEASVGKSLTVSQSKRNAEEVFS